MELRDYIEQGAKKAGSVAALARTIGVVQQPMNEAKHHRRPLPLDAAIKLADFIGEDRIDVISANELATEKKPEKQDFWRGLLNAPKTGQLSYIRHMMN